MFNSKLHKKFCQSLLFPSLPFSSLLFPPLPKKGSFMQPNWFEATLLFEAHHLSTCLIKKIATENNRIVQWLGRGCSSLRYSSSEIQKLIMQAGPMIMQLGWPAGHPSIHLKLGALLTKNILCCSMTSTLLIVRKAWQEKGVLGPQGPQKKRKKKKTSWVGLSILAIRASHSTPFSDSTCLCGRYT